MTILRHGFLASLLVFGTVGCSSDNGSGNGGDDDIDAAVSTIDASVADPDAYVPPGNGTVGSSDETTFNHPDSSTDLFELIDRLTEEGPPYYNARVHGCPKVRYTTMGNLLESRGVDLATMGETQAGFMWANSDQALGAPNYGARARENPKLTTASAAKLFDIFIQAAPEIITAMPTLPACQIGGQGVEMFNANDTCTIDGITCLIGSPAKIGHIDLCNNIVQAASDTTKGKHIAVAALLAAANTCE